MAERWHARLSKVLGHQLTIRQPIILYANHPDFRSTTAIPGFIGVTTGGVTEALRRRLVMPLAGPLGETDHVLGHELVHAFQFDITSRLAQQGGGLPGALQLPLWFVEGMAEYLSLGPVDAHTAKWMRDAVRRDELPEIKDLDNPKYFPYRYGHAFWAFVGGRYADQTIGQLLIDAARAGNVDGAIQAVLGVATDELSQQWHASLTSEYGPVLQQTSPPEKYGRIVLSKERGGGELNVSPVLSRDGKHIIFFSERDLFSIDLFLADAATGKIIDKITETAVDPHFDALQFVNSAGSWSADGRKFAFGSISGGKPELTIYDVQRRRTASRLDFPDLGEIHHPTWSPDGRFIAFSANVAGVTDLFIVELQTKKLRRLTSDAFADLQPAWSPDGTSIAFVTDRFGSNLADLSFAHTRLALLNPDTGQIEPVPAFPAGKHINPQWSSDGDSLYFISDRDGISNIYRVAVATGEIAQITNLHTGVSGITSLSPAFSVAADTDQVAFSAYDAGDYNVLLLDRTALAGQPPSDAVAALSAAVLPPRQRAAGQVASLLDAPQSGLIPPREFETSDYKASLGFDYFAPPTISVGVSNYGSLVGGGTALYFSDLLGYHHLMTAFQTVSTGENFLRNFSAVAAYQNQKHRWNWGFAGGQVPFLTGGFGRFLANVNGEPAVVEQSQLFWEINREISGVVAYPFNRAQRIEFTSGYRNVDFVAEEQTVAFSAVTGQLLLNQTRDIPLPIPFTWARRPRPWSTTPPSSAVPARSSGKGIASRWAGSAAA